MRRRVFMSTGFVGIIGIFAAMTQTKCGSSTTPNDPSEQRTFTSSNVNAHTHTVTIEKTDVQNPPAGGISRSTSSSGAHTHSFAMTQAELQTVNSGGPVVVTTGAADGHTHTFTITKWF